jgi:hypothetical protein
MIQKKRDFVMAAVFLRKLADNGYVMASPVEMAVEPMYEAWEARWRRYGNFWGQERTPLYYACANRFSATEKLLKAYSGKSKEAVYA